MTPLPPHTLTMDMLCIPERYRENARDYANTYAEQYAAQEVARKASSGEARWIAVAERLPENVKPRNYLVSDGSEPDEIELAMFAYGHWYDSDGGAFEKYRIDHYVKFWRELPAFAARGAGAK